nr:MAG TPA: hypothetical protein [Caudoviricetes sp.]
MPSIYSYIDLVYEALSRFPQFTSKGHIYPPVDLNNMLAHSYLNLST